MNILFTKQQYIFATFSLFTILVIGMMASTTVLAETNTKTKGKNYELSDAQIGAIVSVAGNLDISYGKIAMSKTKNKEVRKFAERMVTDHTAVQNAVIKLATRLNLVPEENETSRGLAANGVKVREKLNSLGGKEFDKYYIDNEVAYHELVVTAMAKLLIPNAKNPELKAALEQALPLFTRHLEHAKMVQINFNKGKSKTTHSMSH
jgi:putative membrane protein